MVASWALQARLNEAGQDARIENETAMSKQTVKVLNTFDEPARDDTVFDSFSSFIWSKSCFTDKKSVFQILDKHFPCPMPRSASSATKRFFVQQSNGEVVKPRTFSPR